MKNETYAKPMYKCGICDAVYDSISERSNCEKSCLKNKCEEERQAAAKKKAEEKKMRKEAVDEAVENALRLINAYTSDYGHYEYNENCIWPSKIWHYFG